MMRMGEVICLHVWVGLFYNNNNIVIATIFGTWHDSWAVVACAKFCCDVIISNWIRAKWNFHHIWIVMKKSLVKWVPVSLHCITKAVLWSLLAAMVLTPSELMTHTTESMVAIWSRWLSGWSLSLTMLCAVRNSPWQTGFQHYIWCIWPAALHKISGTDQGNIKKDIWNHFDGSKCTHYNFVGRSPEQCQ